MAAKKDEPVDEKPVDETPEPTPVPPEPEPTKEELDADIDALKAEVREEAEQAVTSKIVEALGGGGDTAWEKEKRQPTPQELVEHVEGSVRANLQKEQDQLSQQSQLQQQEAQRTAQGKAQQVNAKWDNQLVSLRASGKLPAIKEEIQQKMTKGETLTAEDHKDPGLSAQIRMFQTAHQKVQSGELGDDPNMWEVYERFYEKDTQPPGAYAPVSMGRKSVEQPSDEFSYEDIHDKPLDQIIRGE